MKILIAEDDKNLLHALKTLFQRNQYTVDAVDNGLDALEYLQIGEYAAAVLDVMMPKMDGITVVQRLRSEKNTTPILLLTAKSEIEDRVVGLDMGANDYLTKPFDIRELLARVRVLTRQREQQSSKLGFENITLDTVTFQLNGPLGTQVLVNKEYQTMLALMQSAGKVLSVQQIMESAWDPDSAGQETALWNVVYNLRKKLDAVGADIEIKNRRYLGYVLEKKR